MRIRLVDGAPVAEVVPAFVSLYQGATSGFTFAMLYTLLVPAMFVKLPLPVGDPIKLPFLTLYYIGQAQGPSLSEARSIGLYHGPENRRTVLGAQVG
jgi:hypothetical protein